MRLKLSIFIAGLSLGLSAPTFASEPGTYRPGQAYLSVPANGPDQCAEQCMGDAQCKGWNFVQIQNRRAPRNHSICEFNARKATPVPNYMSISGDNQTTSDSPRIIPVGYRTTRIGQPRINKTIPTTVRRVGQSQQPGQNIRPSPSHMARPAQPPAPRTAQRPTPRMATQRATIPSANLRQLKPQLDVLSSAGAASIGETSPRPSFQPQLDTVEKPIFENGSQMTRPSEAPRHQEQSPQAPIAQTPRPSLSDIAPSRADPRLAGAPVSVAQAQRSLFGSLYDDVGAPNALTSQDIPLDPDAPIPTVSSVPVARVDQSPLY